MTLTLILINVRLKLQSILHFKQVVGLNLGKIEKILGISGGKQGAIWGKYKGSRDY